MTTLLRIRNAEKGYGKQVLLDGASADISDEHKVGLVGRNGTGKTTLCRILLGEEELDAGEIQRHPSLRLGYLRQHDPFQPGESVLEFLMRDSGQPDWRCSKLAGSLELKGDSLIRPVHDLSGGWQTRVKLAAILLAEPNLLVMDEPTNFLDLRTQLLLEAFLQNFDCACLVVSHDRGFLRATCDRTLELARGKLTAFTGNIDAYCANRDERREREESAMKTIQDKASKLQDFIDRNRARAATASRARSKGKDLERLRAQMIDLDRDEATVGIRMPQVDARRGSAVRCVELDIGYPELLVASHIGLELDHGERVAIVGDNGQGKTTLLRSLTGSLAPLAGKAVWGHGCNVGVYGQHVYASLPEDQTVLAYLQNCCVAERTAQDARDMAGSFLFRGDDVYKSIRVLSGGERARLCLAGLLLGGFNVLVLDEPANHLDVETADAFASALRTYQGTILFTSHDREFLTAVATDLVEVRDGRVVHAHGAWKAYLERIRQEVAESTESDRGSEKEAKPGKKKRSKSTGYVAPRQQASRSLFKLNKELASAERRADKYHTLTVELDEKLKEESDPDRCAHLQEKRKAAAQRLTEAEDQWYRLNDELEAAKGDSGAS